jgi:penicillin-binding protein 1C
MNRIKNFIIKRKVQLAVLVVLAWFFKISLPSPLFSTPESIVIYDNAGNLLGARTATDGQWRFPEIEVVPGKFEKAILAFEDKRFFYHMGIDPLAFARAIYLNVKYKKVISGGSTITMQTIRLSRKGKSRSFLEKAIELYLALRLEFSFSKKEILSLYASHAPFGGNVVGLEAASWRYFGRKADQLSWAEASTLAVLPNSPSLVHPGKNREILKKKRDKLLQKLHEKNILSKEDFELSLLEELPLKPFPLPNHAPHLTSRILNSKKLQNQLRENDYAVSLSLDLQKKVNEIVHRHSYYLGQNEIHNTAALVIETGTGKVIAYTGNAAGARFGAHNDIIMAQRSPGSLLKPLLYALMMQNGEILPDMLLPDIPTRIGGYSPQNFNLGYDGAVKAKTALARSLNVPAVRMLQQHGVEKFHNSLRKMGVTTLTNSPSHYGLSLILGGGENTLWELCGIYASVARSLNRFNEYGKYNKADFHPPAIFPQERKEEIRDEYFLLDAATAWMMFDAMVDVVRPEEEAFWRSFSTSQRIAWKTGTSFGFRDGWAIGITPEYVVGVWTGNASGEGRPGLTGVSTAAPVLFEIFRNLPSGKWFEQPYSVMENVELCSKSGYRFSHVCEEKVNSWIPKTALSARVCPHHTMVHLDKNGNRVNSNCESPSDVEQFSWFILPPAQEHYFKNLDPSYKTLPPFRTGCISDAATGDKRSMEIIYPKNSSRIKIPKEIDGQRGRVVFEVAHRKSGSVIYWHLNNDFIGSSNVFHQMALQPEPGKYVLTLVDEEGQRIQQNIEFVE